jgi:hypothetical protein
MAKWYYLIDRKQFGPVTPGELRTLAQSGRLKRNDRVRREDLDEWYDAAQLKGLFPNSQANTVSYVTDPNTKLNEVQANGRPFSQFGASRTTSPGSRTIPSNVLVSDPNEPFGEWYSRGIGQQPFLVQGLLWLAYGFIWIPIYWCVTRGRSPRTSFDTTTTTYPPCPHCGTPLDTRETGGGLNGECPYCGRNISAPPVRPDGHRCSRCGGTDIKTFEYVHALGKKKTTGSLTVGGGSGSLTNISDTLGTVASIAGMALGGAHASGQLGTISGLSELCAPPEKAKWALSEERQEYNARVYPKRLAVWKRSWICMTCGTHWVAQD